MKKIAVIIATWFGTGLLPPLFKRSMAGTYGSFFSIPLCYVSIKFALSFELSIMGYLMYLLICLVVMLVGTWSVGIAEIELGPRRDWKGKIQTHDQNQIVIDETIGMLVSCIPFLYSTPKSLWLSLLIAFGLFRFFDIAKVYPANALDKVENPWGVMLDDVAAGVYTAICLHLILLLNIF
jgi:phosphatidylglycerophosphatase A